MLIIIGLSVLLALFALTDALSPRQRMEEYCRLECKENKIRDHSICC